MTMTSERQAYYLHPGALAASICTAGANDDGLVPKSGRRRD
jgi:hypothetical protein